MSAIYDIDLPLWSAASFRLTKQSQQVMLNEQKEKSIDAQEIVAERAGSDWADYCLELIRSIAKKNPRFTSDHVMIAMERKPHDSRALGPMMKAAQRSGFIKPLEVYEKSIRRHATPLRVWESLINESL